MIERWGDQRDANFVKWLKLFKGISYSLSVNHPEMLNLPFSLDGFQCLMRNRTNIVNNGYE